MSGPDLNVLAAFLPEFERPGFSPGDMVFPAKGDDRVFEVGYAALSAPARDFASAAYRSGWVLESFDWLTWSRTAEARDLLSEPAAIAQATAEQLAKLLTLIMRQDRFVEGALLGRFRDGSILAIVRRAVELRDRGAAMDTR